MATRKGKDIQRVNPSSILDLKAELLKKSDQFKREKDQFASTSKDGFVGGGRQFKVTKTTQRDPKKQSEPEVETPGAELEASWVALQRKARDYELLAGVDTEEQGKDDILVDFLQKQSEARFVKAEQEEQSPQEEQLEGPTMVSRDMLREQERLEWEQQAQKLETSNHFDSRKEIRTMGVGFYQFAASEEARKEQMQQLNALRHQTLDKRERMGKLKEAKKEALEQRKRQILEKRKHLESKRVKMQEEADVDSLLSSLRN